MKVHEFETIVRKLGLKVRNSGDRLAWFEYDWANRGAYKRSHGNKEQPGNMIRQQLKLNENQLAGLIKCNVSLEDYIKILKAKGVIAERSGGSSPQKPVQVETTSPRASNRAIPQPLPSGKSKSDA